MSDPWGLPEGEHDHRLAEAVERLRLQREARRIVDAEDSARAWVPPPITTPDLAQELLRPIEDAAWRVHNLLPAGGNALLTALAKSGKTTMVANLIRSLVDDEPFLGSFHPAPLWGRVGVWDYEMSRSQHLRWIGDVRIANAHRVSVMYLRGTKVPITSPAGFDWAVKWLQENSIQVWVIDPFARAFIGDDGNSDTVVGPFLETLDAIKAAAGVEELILVAHTPKQATTKEGKPIMGRETARGSQRLEDWADVLWFMGKAASGSRYFHARGRDVEVPRRGLVHDAASRRVRLSDWIVGDE